MNRIGYTVLMIALALPVPGAILWRYMNPIPAGSLPIDRPLAAHGDTALCRDGHFSFSRHASGTCSHHGGVQRWDSHP